MLITNILSFLFEFPQFRCLVDKLRMFYKLSLLFFKLFFLNLLERNRLRVADLGVAGGGRPWLLAAAEDRNVEK